MKTLFTGISCPNPEFIHTPLIEIKSLTDNSALMYKLSCLSSYDYILFTSTNTVVSVFKLIDCLPQGLRVVSIGDSTSKSLIKAGITNIEQTIQDNSYGVIDYFSLQPRGKVLIPRSNIALDIIPKGLQQLGFSVTTVTAYNTCMPENPKIVDLCQIDRIVFTSPSTIDNFISLYGKLPTDKQLITRGPITEQHLQLKIKEQTL